MSSTTKAPLISDDDPCTLVFTEIGGQPHTVAVSNDAIAHALKRPGARLMVEECSDFVSAHRDDLISAAAKSLARRGSVNGRILLVAGDF